MAESESPPPHVAFVTRPRDDAPTVASSDDGAPSEAGSFRHSLSRHRQSHSERASFMAATPIEEYAAKYQVVKVSWRGKYERIFALAPTRFCTIDPKDFEVTNTWSMNALVSVNLDASDSQGFTLALKGSKKDEQLKLRCRFRSRLLSDLYRLQDQFLKRHPKQANQYSCTKWSRNGTTFNCVFEIGTDGIVCTQPDGSFRSKYLYADMEHLTGLTDSAEGFSIGYWGRSRLFFSDQRQQILHRIQTAAAAIGCVIKPRANVTSATIKEERTVYGTAHDEPFVQFAVRKVTPKYDHPVNRVLSLHEKALIELDNEGKVVACYDYRQIYVLVRRPNSKDQFDVQFGNGETRNYLSSDRDGVLAAIYDISITCEENPELFISCVVNERGLRLLPLFAQEDANETRSFFNDTSIASCYLQRMASVSKFGSSVRAGDKSFIEIVAEFNANVPVSGISYNTKQSTVSDALRPVGAQLYYVSKTKPIPVRPAATLLQALFRIASSYHGFREICQVVQIADSITNLLLNGDEFVVFWTTLLLRKLTAHEVPSSAKSDKASIKSSDDVEAANKKLLFGNSYLVQSLIYHLADIDVEPAQRHGTSARRAAGPLVIMGLLQTLEGCLCSKVSTTGPIEFQRLIEEVTKFYSTLLKILFQSRCATTVEACTLLLKSTLEGCDPVEASRIRDAALTEGIVLRHLYQSIFDDSYDQRCVSRYLISLWMSHHSSSKQLLSRVIPPGFLYFLKEPPGSIAEHAEFDRVEREALELERKAQHQSDSAVNDVEGLSIDSDEDGGVSFDEVHESDVFARHAEPLEQRSKSMGLANGARTGETFDQRSFSGSHLNASESSFSLDFPSDSHASFDAPIENEHSRARMLKKLQSSMIGQPTSNGSGDRAVPARIRKRDIALGFITSTLLKDKGTSSGLKNAHRRSKKPVLHPSRGQENFRLLFYQLSMDHEAVQVIWNKTTREELRQSLLHELQRFSRFQISQGHMQARWNHADFHVTYLSLADEIVVGGCYLRILSSIRNKMSFFGSVAGEDDFVDFSADQVPVRNPKELLLALYCRLLRENIRAEYYDETMTSIMCIKSMGIVAGAYSSTADAVDFEEIEYLGTLVDNTVNASILESLVHAIRALCLYQANAKRVLNSNACLDLVVRLLQFVHTSDRNNGSQLSVKKVWLVETSSGETLGEEHVLGLKQKLDSQALDLDTLWIRRRDDPVCETEDARKRLLDIAQLRWELRLRGDMHPLQLAHDAVSILLSVVRCNSLSEGCSIQEVDQSSDKAPVFPLPRGTTSLWEFVRKVIPVLLRTSWPELCTSVATLLELLYRNIDEASESNASHVAELHEWGLFYAAFAGEFSNAIPVAGLLKWTHLLQDGCEGSSALKDLLPDALIDYLCKSSATEFSHVYTHGVQSPEVIWSEGMRSYLQQCCQVHMRDFVEALGEDMTSEWKYCPMAPISFGELEEELWCGGVYLGKYCDNADFSIAEPLTFMRSLTAVWRQEASRVESVLSEAEARRVLDVGDEVCDDASLRAKFKLQAQQLDDSFHSSRRIDELNEAYTILTCPRASLISRGHDPVNLLLILNSLILTCNRHPDALSSYEFDAYEMLLQLLASHCTADGTPPSDSSTRQVEEISVCAAELLYNTCAVSADNGDILLEQDLNTLERVVNYCVTKISDSASDGEEWVLQVCFFVLQTITGLAASPNGREWISQTTTLATDLVKVVWVWNHSTQKSFLLSKITQQVLEAVSRSAALAKNQDILVRSGLLWQLFLLISRYDVELDDATVLARLDSDVGSVEVDFDNMVVEVQNLLAIMSIRSLCRLGGFFVDGSDLASPKNALVKSVVDALFTPNLSELLVLPSHHEFLKLFHGECESYTLFWNESMRRELLEFIETKTSVQPTAPEPEDYSTAIHFRYEHLADLLYIGGLYIETLMGSLFVLEQNPVPHDTAELGLTPAFFHELFSFIDNGELVLPRILTDDGEVKVLAPYAGWRIETEQLETMDRVTALNCLAITATIAPNLVEKSIVADVSAVKMLLRLLFPPDNEVHQSEDAERSLVLSTQLYLPCRIHCINILKVLSCGEEFAKMAIPLGICDILIELIHLCKDVGPDVLEIIRNFCSHGAGADFVREILHSGVYLEFIAWMLLVEEIIVDDEFSVAEQLRVPSALVLGELVRDEHPVCIDSRRTLCRFFPPAVVRQFAADPEHVVEFLMADHTYPELVWNDQFRHHLRSKVIEFLNVYYSATSTTETDDGHFTSVVDSFEIDYSSIYPLPMAGNVYLQLFMEMPTCTLSDPLYFATSLWGEFQVLFRQLAHMTSAYRAKLSRDDDDMVQHDIDLLDLVGSALVCVLQVHPELLDKLAEMQIPENCCVLLNDTVRQQSCESCVVNAMRVLRVCSLSRACIASIEPVCSTVFSCLVALINPIRGGPLHFEAGFVLEIMRRIVSKYPEHGDRNSSSGIVFVASRLDLFSFLLNILENPSGIGQVKEPNIVRAEAIEILNMLETDPIQGSTAHQILKKHKKWEKKYKFEPTDVVRNLTTEDPFLQGLFPQADRAIREYNRSAGRTSERSSASRY